MGATFSCNGATYDALEESFDAMLVRSFSFNEDGVRTDLRSVSFNGRDKEPTILKRLASGKMFMEGSVSFKNTREMDTMIPIQSPKEMEMENHGYKSVPFDTNEFCNSFLRSNSFTDVPITPMPIMDQNSHDAALKLQKVYKSFRTRRKLADCAVLVEQRWWKLLDFAELKRSSVSFFEIEKPETAVSRWSRARTRAAKVGKGLSKDEKAQKLAFQHWLEAIDPRHRYGHNLSFYYVTWLHCESQQPFFYWLDIGEGKEVNIVDKCPRSKLQQQCIKYLGPIERKVYEVVVEDGKFIYKHTGQLLDSTGEPGDVKWIFVLSTSKTLYVGQKCKGRFQHSSFLAGGATSAAGRLVVETGILKAVWPHSGHYRPTDENFREFISFLKENNVDITDVQLSPAEEEEESGHGLGLGLGLTSNASDSDLTRETEAEAEAEAEADTENANTDEVDSAEGTNAKRSDHFKKRLTNLEIPKRVELFTKSVAKGPTIGPSIKGSSEKDATAGYETAEDSLDSESDDDYMAPKLNLFEGEQEKDEEDIVVPKEIILRRINSKKGMGSYQLGKQLSCKWTTGAGPRIGCVRDYPSELQCRALEQVCLSPRSAAHSRHHSSPLNMLFPSPRPPMPPSPLVSTPWPKLPTPGPMRRDATTTTKNTR